MIEKHKKSWDCFVLVQFYHGPPSQGTIYKIVNGIWSKNYRDITVSKMEGFAFLFRIPNASTRNKVIKQCLWQIEGQTMFVDKWEPGVIPTKLVLTSAPIWLELRNVPLQFFNEDGLERIAGLVGHPKYIHLNTANKTVLDVAKVFTVIDRGNLSQKRSMCSSIRVTSLEYWSLAPGCHRCANNVRRLDIQQKDASVRRHRAQPATPPLIPLRTVQDQGRRRRIEHHHEGTSQSPKFNSGGLARLKLFLTCQFPLIRSWQETAVV